MAGLLAAAALGACKKGNEYASNDSTRIDSAAGRTDTMSANAVKTDSGTPAGKWADASVLGYLTVANDGELRMGRLGERMATNSAVKSFARMLVIDHQKLLAETKSLSGTLSATADTTAGDAHDLVGNDMDEVKDLSGKTKGADWDKAFIDHVIDGHQKILGELQDGAKNSPSATVRSSLEKASGVYQQHLTKAQDIKANVLKD
jgi:putative membrane protein